MSLDFDKNKHKEVLPILIPPFFFLQKKKTTHKNKTHLYIHRKTVEGYKPRC